MKETFWQTRLNKWSIVLFLVSLESLLNLHSKTSYTCLCFRTLSQSTLASLPMIGVDDYSDINLAVPNSHNNQSSSHYASSQPSQIPQYTNNSHHHKSNNDHNSFHNNHHQLSDNENGIGEITDSSSSSSDSDSDSDDNNMPTVNNSTNKNANANKMTNGYTNGNTNSSMKIDTLINDDLCLSESESDWLDWIRPV